MAVTVLLIDKRNSNHKSSFWRYVCHTCLDTVLIPHNLKENGFG